MKATKLNRFSPCSEAIRYMASEKTIKSAWDNCQRGDWMLWVAKRLLVDDKKLTLAKAYCAKQVEHLMKDQRSKDAIQACFDYVNGKITKEELAAADAAAYAAYADYSDSSDAAYAAYDAAYVAYDAAYAAYDAAYADYNAAYAAAAAAAAAYAAYAAAAAADADAADAADADAAAAAAAAAAYAAADAKTTSLKKSADICREFLTEAVLLAYKKLR